MAEGVALSASVGWLVLCLVLVLLPLADGCRTVAEGLAYWRSLLTEKR